MSESGTGTSRPSQVTLAGWMTVSASIFLVIALFESVSALQTLEVREGVEEFLAEPPGSGLSLDVAGALQVMRVVMLVAAACAAAAGVLGIYVLRRDRTARVVLSVLAAILFLTAPLAGGFLAMMVAVSAVLLWSRPANDWFAGRNAAPTKSSSHRKGVVMTENPPDPDRDRPAPYVPGAGGSDQPPTQPWGGAGQEQPEKGSPPPGGPVWAGAPDGPGGSGEPRKRPGTVTAAAWITWVSSGLTALMMALLTVMFLTAGDAMFEQMRGEPQFADLQRELDAMGTGPGALVDAMWVFGLVALVWSIAAFVLAVFAYRGKNWARIALVVSASVVVLFSLLTIFSGVSLVPLLAAGATIVLLFVGGANDWYAGRASGGQEQGRQGQGPPNAW